MFEKVNGDNSTELLASNSAVGYSSMLYAYAENFIRFWWRKNDNNLTNIQLKSVQITIYRAGK